MDDKAGRSLADKIEEKALPLVRSLGYDLADIEFVKEGANRYLRFFIEHPDPGKPIDTDDCQRVSAKLSDWLDEADPIPQAYFLEVSSPGIERLIRKDKDFIRFQGRMVRVNTFAPVEGKKMFVGELGPATGDTLTIRLADQELMLPKDKISSVRLHWNDEEEE